MLTKIKIKKKGFILAEAILALSLITASTVFRAQEDKRLNEISRAQEFAVDLSQVVSAIDKRVFLDGIKHPSGTWGQTWSTTDEVVNNMISYELVGKDNPSCGDLVKGWSPVKAANSTSSLVTCNLFDSRKIPFEFDMTAKRVGSATSPNLINEWSINLYHKSPDDFKKYSNLYHHILQKTKLHNSLGMTGSLTTKTVNRVTGDHITMSGCLTAGSICAIQLKYQTSTSPLLSEDVYLRTDGSNAMRNTLRFSSGATVAECYTQDSPTTTKKTECGLDFDVTNDSLDVVSDLVFSSGMRLVQAQGEAPIVVTCKDEVGLDVYCGVTTVRTPLSVTSSAYLDSIIANDFIALTNKFGSKVFDVDEQGNVNATGDVNVTGSINSQVNISAKGNIAADGNANIKGAMTVGDGAAVGSGLLTVFGNANFKRDVTISGTSTSKLAVSQTFRASKKVSVDSSCGSHSIGDFATTASGSMVSCQSLSGSGKIWAPVTESVPVGTISIWSKATPPAGWIECKGQNLSSYPQLRAVVGNYAPDLRGVFVRGWDHGRGLDSGRGIGTYQADADQRWTGKYNTDDAGAKRAGGVVKSTYTSVNGGAQGGDRNSLDVTLDNARVVRTAAESRPKNVAMVYIIKYK